jgi:hypothetical protein
VSRWAAVEADDGQAERGRQHERAARDRVATADAQGAPTAGEVGLDHRVAAGLVHRRCPPVSVPVPNTPTGRSPVASVAHGLRGPKLGGPIPSTREETVTTALAAALAVGALSGAAVALCAAWRRLRTD